MRVCRSGPNLFGHERFGTNEGPSLGRHAGLPHRDTTAGGELSVAPSLGYGRDDASSEVFHDGRARPPFSGGGIAPGFEGAQEGCRLPSIA